MILFLDIMPDKSAMSYPVEYISPEIDEGVKVFSSDHWLNDWLVSSTGSYAWMTIHLKTLCEQYTHHTGVVHEGQRFIEDIFRGTRHPWSIHISHGALSSFPLDLPDEYREVRFDNGEIHMLDYVPMRDAVKLYREYILSTTKVNELVIND